MCFYFGFFCLYEIVGLIYIVNESYFKRKVSFLGLIVQSLKKSAQIVYPKNWLVIIYVLLLMPLTSMGIGNSFISSVSVPDFINEYILQVPWLLFLYIVVLLVLILFVYFTFFSFNFFVLENISFNKAVLNSLKLMREGLFRFKRLLTYWGFTAVVIRLITFGIVMFIVILMGGAIVLFAVEEGSLPFLWCVVLGSLSFLQNLLNILSTVFTVSMTVSFVSAYYFKHIEKDYSQDPVVIKSFHFRYFKTAVIVLTSFILIFSVASYTLAAYILMNYRSYLGTIKGPAVTAHRGASALAPENTRASLEKAIELGANYVEFDLTQTKDGVLVVAHDNDLSSRFGQDKVISQPTYDELRDVDVGSYFAPEFSSERLITFEEAIQICKGRIKMNIELKPTADDHDLVETAVRIFKENDLYEDGFFASVDLETLLEVERIAPEIGTCYNTSIAYGQIHYLPIDYFSVEQTFVTGSLIDSVHNSSKEIFAWTVDNEEKVKELTMEGINNIVTNDITMAKETIEEVVKVNNSNRKDYAYRYYMNTLFDVELNDLSIEDWE